jgi:Fe-S-cluster containining protein
MSAKERSLYVCTGCGNCCRWPGYVRVTDNDIIRIADYLGMEIRDFVDEYTIVTDDRRGLSIGEREDGACRFLNEDNSCAIQPVKPQQCIDFPNKWRYPDFEKDCPAIKLRILMSKVDGETDVPASYQK